MPLSRTPRAEVRRQLRTEVGFGCPHPGCRKPFLEWHHFDPPWHEKEHHDPAGMIAFCSEHHKAADRGIFSKEEMRLWKRPSTTDDVRANFPWSKREFLVRMGGVYHGGSKVAFAVSNQPVIEFKRQENDRLTLSFTLKAADGSTLMQLDENMLTAYPTNIHDLEVNTGPTKVKVWFAKRNVGLELSFSRITKAELASQLDSDHQRGKEAEQRALASLSDEIRKMMEGHSARPASWGEGLSDHLKEAINSSDPVGTMVKRWAEENCLDDEGKIPFVDFSNMIVNESGRVISIRDGIREGQGHIGYLFAANNGLGSFNL